MNRTVTATALARDLSRILDRMALRGEAILIERNHRPIARLVPCPGRQTALEALADLYRTLPDDAAGTWESDARGLAGNADGIEPMLDQSVRDPWI